jgi:branched-chain amino acid transport system substrate-binding protein
MKNNSCLEMAVKKKIFMEEIVKHGKLTKILGLMCLSLMIAAVPLLGACGGSDTPDGEEGVLKIGQSVCYTGPAASKGRPMGNGKTDAIKYINEELGGVNGYQIEVVWRDNGYDAAKATTIINELIGQDCLMFTTNASAMMSVSMEIANRAEMPGFSVFGAPNLIHPPQHIYAQTPDYGDDWAIFAEYYLENIWTGEGNPKMALHLLSNPTGYGARDAAKALAEEMGIDIVITEEHSKTTGSEIESLTRIKDADVDVIYISSIPEATAIIVKNAVQMGIYPDVTIGCGHASYTSALVELAGVDDSGKSIVEGVYGVFPTVVWGEDVPGMAKMTEYVRAHHPEDEGNMDYITTWAEGLVTAEILRLAVENAGYDNLTPQVVEEQGFKMLNGFDVGGLHGPVTYVEGDNRLAKSARVFQIQDAELVPISEWIEAPLIKYEDFDWFGK